MITRVTTANHEEWLALRKKYIGGSDAAAVVGLNAYSSPYALWAEKTGRVPSFEGNLATEVGSFLEEFVAQKFCDETGKKVRRVNQSFLNSLYPFAIANIDRDVVGEDAGLEIKTTSELNMKKFKNGEYPANYYCQCMHYMAVTGKQRWYLAVLIGNREFKVFTIERDEAEIDALMTAEALFWEYVKHDSPPPVDGAEATADALAAVYPKDDGGSVDLFAYREILRQYSRLTAEIKSLEKMRDEAANAIKAYIGNGSTGECDGFKVSWKAGSRRTFDTKLFEKEHPNMDLGKYYKETATRTFRVVEIKK